MTNRKKILKGHSNFGYMVGNNGYFIDKTPLIKEFLDNSDFVVVLLRPRRFGKTLNLSMIEYFFDVNKKESAHLFKGFKISEDKAFCEAHQNKYPVINVTFKNARGEDWETCYQLVVSIIAELYRSHKYLLSSSKLDKFEKEEFATIMSKKGNYSDYANSIFTLSRNLKTHFGEPAIILIDEYDSYIIEGFSKGFYKKAIDFKRIMLGIALKDNDNAKKGLITGIMRIAKESLFSGLNNPGVYTLTSFDFADKFGFTAEETQDVLTYFGLEEHIERVKEWYDGYQFGLAKEIYNPWSIVNYITRYREGLQAWWVNSGTDTLIKHRIVQPDPNATYNTLQKLISGETIQEKLYENFVFPYLDLNRELLWTLLAFSGYLTQVKKIDREEYLLKIPNYEVKTLFQDIIIEWLLTSFKVKRKLLIATTEHLLNNQLEAFERNFKIIMGDTLSYWDKGGEPERVYQAYVLGMLAIVGDDYIIRSNRESGKGRYDVMIMPHDKSRYGVVMEIKQIERDKNEKDKTFKGRINRNLKEATEQIEKKKYYKELVAHKITKIIKLPIVFAEKEPYVFPINRTP